MYVAYFARIMVLGISPANAVGLNESPAVHVR
jgi:hypothetical protein